MEVHLWLIVKMLKRSATDCLNGKSLLRSNPKDIPIQMQYYTESATGIQTTADKNFSYFNGSAIVSRRQLWSAFGQPLQSLKKLIRSKDNKAGIALPYKYDI